MKIEKIKAKTSAIISKHLHVDNSEIAGYSTLRNLGADFLDQVEIFLSIEKQFKIFMHTKQPEALYNSTFNNMCMEIYNTINKKQTLTQ